MTVIREDTGAVAHLTLNRPDALNALSDDLLAALKAAFSDLADDTSIRAILVSGAGKAFCAGHDLKEMQAGRQAPDGGAAYFDDLFGRCGDVMQMIPRLPQPVIAQVHGIATAAGCQLVASCDLAVAAVSAQFGVNGVNSGLFCSTPMVPLSRNISRKNAFEMLTTGKFLNANQALEQGLINRVAPDGELASQSLELAQQIAGQLGSAIAVGKRAFYRQLEMNVAQAYDHTRKVMVENMLHRDTDEGIQAFIEKRDPDWRQ